MRPLRALILFCVMWRVTTRPQAQGTNLTPNQNAAATDLSSLLSALNAQQATTGGTSFSSVLTQGAGQSPGVAQTSFLTPGVAQNNNAALLSLLQSNPLLLSSLFANQGSAVSTPWAFQTTQLGNSGALSTTALNPLLRLQARQLGFSTGGRFANGGDLVSACIAKFYGGKTTISASGIGSFVERLRRGLDGLTNIFSGGKGGTRTATTYLNRELCDRIIGLRGTLSQPTNLGLPMLGLQPSFASTTAPSLQLPPLNLFGNSST